MKLKSVYSVRDTIEEVVSDLSSQLNGFNATALIFFASSHFDPSIGKKMQDTFKGVTVFGCTTAGEITSGKMLKGSVVAMALGPEVVTAIKVAVLENIKSGVNVKPAFQAFEEHFQVPVRKMDLAEYVGIVLIDGLSGREEVIMNQIGDQADLSFLGGSSGDDLKFKATYVYSGGKAYTDAALLVLLHMKNGFDIIKTQSFNILDKKLVVTKSDEVTRDVIEFDGQPAALAYAAAIGTTVSEISNHFMHNPVGLIINDEPYVRSPQRVNDQSITFYCHIPEGMEVSLLESMDIMEDMRDALVKAKQHGPVAGIINFNCILRTLELEKNGKTEEYGKLFTEIPTVGFSTYGEEYIGHINQTATILVLR